MQALYPPIQNSPACADYLTAAEWWSALLVSIAARCTVVPTRDLSAIEASIARTVVLCALGLLAEDIVTCFGASREGRR